MAGPKTPLAMSAQISFARALCVAALACVSAVSAQSGQTSDPEDQLYGQMLTAHLKRAVVNLEAPYPAIKAASQIQLAPDASLDNLKKNREIEDEAATAAQTIQADFSKLLNAAENQDQANFDKDIATLSSTERAKHVNSLQDALYQTLITDNLQEFYSNSEKKFEANSNLFNVLINYYGQWHFNSGQLQFDNDQAEQSFIQALSEVQTAKTSVERPQQQ